MPERRPPRHEGPRRPQGPGAGHGPGSRPRKPGPRPGSGDASRPPRREAQGAKPPFRPRPAGPHQRPDRPQRPQRPEGAERPDRGESSGDADRLQKVLAHAGIGSRRACEDFIIQGRVAINGRIVRELGTKVVAGRDRIAVDGQPIRDERPAYIAVNKPAGYVSTNDDPSGRPRVVDLVPDIPQRVYTVGRLDEMSVGLMLLTNDGELANRLSHPKFGVEKIYRAVVAGTPEPEVYQKLVEGVWLAEGKVRAKRVKPVAHKGDATVVELVLAEGKNREVRRMFAKFGHKVMTLTRVAVGPITLKGIKPGGWRFLTSGEVDLLRKVAAGMPVPSGRTNNDRPIRPPTRGPRAPQNNVPPTQGYQGRPQSMNQRPPQSSGPQSGPLRPRSFQGNSEGRAANMGPRPPRSQGPGAGRPPQYGQDQGPRPGRPPQRFQGQDENQGPRPGRPPQYGQDQGPRPPGRPSYSQQGQGDGQGPRPGRPPQYGQDQGPRRPMSPRPQGPGSDRPPQRFQGQGQGQGPRPGRPQGPPPPQRPPGRVIRDQPPPRRIIGLELPSEQPPSMRRPTPRPSPRPGGPPNRPLKRPGIPPRRRPSGDADESS